MSRATPEWIGRNDSEPFPSRVRLRIFERDKGCCQCGCGRAIRAGEKWETDHRIALINGGNNQESNGCTLLTEHHRTKTAHDVAEKSMVYAKRIKHFGISKRKGRPMVGSRASNWKRKMDGSLVRREK